MALVDQIIGNIRSNRESRKPRLRMGLAGEGPELPLIAAAFREAGEVTSLLYYHPNTRAAERTAKQLGAESARSAEEFVSGIGAAELLTLPGGRRDLAESLLRAGVHVSLRKPFAERLDEATCLRAAARESGALLRVDDEAFFFEPYRKLKSLIRNMEIGELCAARFRLNLAGQGGWGPRAELLKDNFGLFHPCFDILAFATDLIGDVESVVSYLNPIDTRRGGQSLIALKFKQPGLYGVMEFSYAPNTAVRSEGYPCDTSMELAGTDGIIWANHFHGKMTETPWLEVRRGKKHYVLGIGSGMALEWTDALRASAAHFAEQAARGGHPRPNVARHFHGLEILTAALEAAESKSEIHL